MKKWLKRAWTAMFDLKPVEKPVAATSEPVALKRAMRIGVNALSRMFQPVITDSDASSVTSAFTLPQPMPGVIPRDLNATQKQERLAYDSMINDAYAYVTQGLVFDEGLQFMGYPYLAELTQRPEYRRPAEIFAKEMTRKWMKIQSTGDGKQEAMADKIKAIEGELKRLEVQKRFSEAVEQDGFFGRSQIFIDMGDDRNDRDLMRAPLIENTRTLRKGKKIKRLVIIEPIWTYPNFYNSFDPLDKTFFKPETWYIMGLEVHSSRFLTIVSRKVPDILKPAYCFGGLSLSQLMKPYVDNWLRTRQSVSDMLHSFSLFGLKTNLGSVLNNGAGDELIARAQLFNATRDNRGLQILDKDTEDFFNVSAPLGGLDHLQAQSQEHMSACSGIPLIKLLGITPSGLNASSDGEIRSFYDWVESQQEAVLTPHLMRLISIIQLYLFGEVDAEITIKWEPLWSLDEAQQAAARKTEADTDAVLIDKGIIDASEARTRLAGQEESAYPSLDLNKEIVAPGQEEAMPGDPNDPNNPADPNDPNAVLEEGADPDALKEAPTLKTLPGVEEGHGGPGSTLGKTSSSTSANEHAQDEFVESQHPRDHGKFATTAGGSSGAAKPSAREHMQTAKVVNGERRAQGGGKLPEHIASLRIPPAWTEVSYAPNPGAALLATGKDSKGRRQWVYSAEHSMKQAAVKFSRILELNKKFDKVLKQNDTQRQSKDAKTREHADAMHLVMMTGIRPGSDNDTKADKKAYGATTLEGRHVVVDGDKVSLQFVGKKGVDLNIPITDAATARMLKLRKAQAGGKGTLFPSTTRSSLSEYAHTPDGGGFKTKDFRTLLGTRTAMQAVSKVAKAPTTPKEYKQAVKAVATHVASVLGNTPTIALQSYINPAVFAKWDAAHAKAA